MNGSPGQAEYSNLVRGSLQHPVVDADGHFLETPAVTLDYVEDECGRSMAGDLRNRLERRPGFGPLGPDWYDASAAERARHRLMRPGWWSTPAENTLDRATAMFPALLNERLDELGIDFAFLYPTDGLLLMSLPEPELRQGVCRALNRSYADMFAAYRDRLEPVAVIPMVTPEEAIAELNHAVELGLRAIVMSHTERPGADGGPSWLDGYGIDSMYDYDPVWQRCADLRLAPTFHGLSMGWGNRRSISNFMFNHIGHFAAAGDFVCKSLFMGGVPRRFPSLRFGFLEGGISWAATLLQDLVGHWEKRRLPDLYRLSPARIDHHGLEDLAGRYASPPWHRSVAKYSGFAALRDQDRETVDSIDEFRACSTETADQLRASFVNAFTFGCEADDPMAALAFNPLLTGSEKPLQAMFASDIGHWDVTDMAQVLAEAYELVERGAMDEREFRGFTFDHAVSFYGAVQPNFFEKTAIAADASLVLEASDGGCQQVARLSATPVERV